GVSLTDGGEISGSTNSTLMLTGVSAADAGSYMVTVTTSEGSVSSQPAVLTVIGTCASPVITMQPQSQVACISEAVFAVAASGPGPITYQWRRNSVNLTDAGEVSGSSTPVLTLTPASYADAGLYDVVVSSPGGSVTSSQATLAISDLLAITTQ